MNAQKGWKICCYRRSAIAGPVAANMSSTCWPPLSARMTGTDRQPRACKEPPHVSTRSSAPLTRCRLKTALFSVCLYKFVGSGVLVCFVRPIASATRLQECLVCGRPTGRKPWLAAAASTNKISAHLQLRCCKNAQAPESDRGTSEICPSCRLSCLYAALRTF
jgi:hypothetical protein